MADTATGTKEGTKEVAKGDGISVKAKIPAGFIAFGSFAVFAVCGGWNKVKRFSQDADNDTSIKLFLLITYLALLRIAYWGECQFLYNCFFIGIGVNHTAHLYTFIAVHLCTVSSLRFIIFWLRPSPSTCPQLLLSTKRRPQKQRALSWQWRVGLPGIR